MTGVQTCALPISEKYAGFADFRFYTVRPDSAHWISGFARARTVSQGLTLHEPPSLPEAEILAHMNADHREAVGLYATRLLGQAPGDWRMVGIDTEGVDLRADTRLTRLAFDQPDAAVRWGMSATVRIALGNAPAIVVPLSALQTRSATPHVWVVDPATRTAQPRAVTLGEGRDDGVVVREGLRDGEWVVTAGANLLLAGQAVRLPDSVPPSGGAAIRAAP